MPSSHSATVAALAMAIALEEGTGGSSFALAVILASIVSVFPFFLVTYPSGPHSGFLFNNIKFNQKCASGIFYLLVFSPIM